MEIIIKNILDFPEADIICHQCNCMSRRASGLAAALFKKYPEADTYSARIKGQPELFGTNTYHKITNGWICNMYAQVYPSVAKPLSESNVDDSYKSRIEAFKKCLIALFDFCNQKNLTSVAFPYRIGCGLAGGDWQIYRDLIEKYSMLNPKINVFICIN